MLVSIQKVGEDSIVVSLFVDILDELTNTVSDGKIQISILIISALSQYYWDKAPWLAPAFTALTGAFNDDVQQQGPTFIVSLSPTQQTECILIVQHVNC